MSILPMVIFRGVRLNEQLAETSMPSLVCLSPKSWISADLLAEWFQHFIKCIPSHRPVVLFMDSHASHITPKILSKTSENGIHLVTFSSHTTHLLQPLDVGVCKPLNEGWRKEMEKFLTEHPGAKPGRYDFNGLLASAYHGAFQSTTVCNSFAKTGLFPFKRDSIADEAIGPSLVTESKDPNDSGAGMTSGE
jgi:hypothetical protein